MTTSDYILRLPFQVVRLSIRISQTTLTSTYLRDWESKIYQEDEVKDAMSFNAYIEYSIFGSIIASYVELFCLLFLPKLRQSDLRHILQKLNSFNGVSTYYKKLYKLS